MKTIKKIFVFIIALTCFLSNSNAQIVYTNVNPDSTISNGSYNLDLNNDGTTDFVLQISSIVLGCSRVPTFKATSSITPASGDNAVMNDGAGYARALDYATTIVPDSQWSNTSQILFDAGTTCTSAVKGYWVNLSNKDLYLGLRFTKGNNTYYGWARLEPGIASLSLKDYAYNSVPGQPISAGQGASIVFPQTAPPIQWQKSLGGSDDDDASSVQQTKDGGYIVAGSSQSNDGDVSGNHGGSDYWIVKLNSSGNIEWQKSLGGSSDEGAGSIQQTTDGGYIATGTSTSTDGDVTGHHFSIYPQDYWVVKLDATGNLQWQKSLGGSGEDVASSVQQTTDGGYIVAGWSTSNDGDVSGNHGGEDCWIVKLANGGSIEWQESLGSSFGGVDEGNSIRQTTDGGYIVAGTAGSNDGDVSGYHGGLEDYWIIKLNNTGNVQWQKCLGGSDLDISFAVQQTSDGGYVTAGYSQSNDGDASGNHGWADFWIVKLGPDITLPLQLISFTGFLENNVTKLNWQTSGEINTADFIVERSDNATNFSSIGKVNAQNTSAITNSYKYTDDAPLQGINYYRLKMEDKDGKFTYSKVLQINYNKHYNITVFPNPFSNSTTISFTLSQSQKVSIRIYDVSGKLIKTIANEQMEAGSHQLVWNASGENGTAVAKGMYYLKFNAGNYAETKKLSIIK